ncbi:cytochrome c3 family protein [Geoalkalibacter subterraneus]|uniref:Doubled CXXCH motif domain-containing protein n=1 Tax=Geoalkalibacter subterraneus TaxID=483547 RepID=A0A0B5FLI3_9BACT|nr:cytochrome c3 family protein [Geoalkalibacter subterraneus]AJF08298.1 hypothetical protein GSUB_17635 [Geoalkalibacter subterraneus]
MKKVLCLLFLLTASVVWGSPHRENLDCYECHLSVPEEGESATLTLKDNIDRVCLSCHDGVQKRGHALGISLGSVSAPADFPLDTRGRMMCATCHIPCEDNDNNPYLLRGELGAQNFCSHCHDNVLPVNGIHYGMAGKFHRVSTYSGVDEFGRGGVERDGQKLDSDSLACLGCHLDGISAPEAKTRFGEYSTHHSGSHPIGMDYESLALTNLELRDTRSVGSTLYLDLGRVSCLSCHDMYAGKKPFVAVSNKGSGLCFTCHIK